ncbi:hypothetical protein JF66_19390 [Cryobacterium sp. MLB-32]|uniref:hypothetical protein n=1 Tax=Cryobacterium sp. MLB-32 TaxID=1529318 RepID=UPI0004E63F8F|nr:hypothetical protein [Cryobacterium sp. MLB-32]KFF58328.1 hypothetical protein JF66_19390 [Cryobacterium sp. MLB-32]
MHAQTATLVIACCMVVVGVAILIWAEPITKFMKLLSDTMTMYPEKLRRRIYTARNLRFAGVWSVFSGLFFLTVAVERMIGQPS